MARAASTEGNADKCQPDGASSGVVYLLDLVHGQLGRCGAQGRRRRRGRCLEFCSNGDDRDGGVESKDAGRPGIGETPPNAHRCCEEYGVLGH